MAFVPARKIILIFYIYIRYLFGEKIESKDHKKMFSNLEENPMLTQQQQQAIIQKINQIS